MSYLRTPDEHELYDAELAAQGHVANHTRVFALNPGAYVAWQGLAAAVKEGMDLRRYELATLAAARRLRSSYCSLAHGKVLRDRFYDADTVRDIAADHHTAGLDAVDVAIMDFADKVTADATSVTAADVDALRSHGLSDEDIFQVVLTAAARCFFSTVLDAVGARPDHTYRDTIEPTLRDVLTVGRPIADEPEPKPEPTTPPMTAPTTPPVEQRPAGVGDGARPGTGSGR